LSPKSSLCRVACPVFVLGLALSAGGLGCGGSSSADPSADAEAASCAPKGECAEIPSACLALEDAGSSGGVSRLRMAQLDITSPPGLAVGAVASALGGGVLPNLEACNLPGQGNFSWLLEFDPEAGTLRTGGAPPVADPREGYCFSQDTVEQTAGSFSLSPITVPASLEGGLLKTERADAVLNLPVFIGLSASNAVVLPVHAFALTEAALSEDGNCIGTYEGASFDPAQSCLPNEELGQTAFENGGSLRGYITLEEADQVTVTVISQSLCVLLSGDPAAWADPQTTPKRCKRDESGAIALRGNWCSSTDSEATPSCADAFKLEASFAASAVEISGLCP
jgi:hypothetical protein